MTHGTRTPRAQSINQSLHLHIHCQAAVPVAVIATVEAAVGDWVVGLLGLTAVVTAVMAVDTRT